VNERYRQMHDYLMAQYSRFNLADKIKSNPELDSKREVVVNELEKMRKWRASSIVYEILQQKSKMYDNIIKF
jgi:hypothetical protein